MIAISKRGKYNFILFHFRRNYNNVCNYCKVASGSVRSVSFKFLPNSLRAPYNENGSPAGISLYDIPLSVILY